MLRTFGLALYHGARRVVGNAHGRIGLVDMLATGAAGTVGIGTKISRVDIDFNIVIDFRCHKNRCERCVSTVS